MANRYWVGGSGNWNDNTNHWSDTSGGSPGAAKPATNSDVFFDSNSASGDYTVTVDTPNGSTYCNNMTWENPSGGHPTFTDGGYSSVMSIYGSLTLVSGMSVSFDRHYSYIYFIGNSDATITSNGAVITGLILCSKGTGYSLSLNDDLSCQNLIIYKDIFDANDHNVTVWGAGFYAVTAPSATVNMGSGTWTFTSNDVDDEDTDVGVFHIYETGEYVVTVNAETSTMKFTDTTSHPVTFFHSNSGKTYNNVYFNRGNSDGDINITGSSTFNDFKDDGSGTHSIIFTNGTTQTVNTFTVSGTAGHLISLNSDTTSTYALTKSGGGTISQDYLNISHCVASPADTWYALSNSVDNQDIESPGSGWIFVSDLSLSVYDSVGVTESLSLYIDFFEISLSDEITISENLSIIIPILTSVIIDVVNIYENIEFKIPTLFILTFDSVEISENIRLVTPVSFISVIDSIDISDEIEIKIPVFFISVIDSIDISDEIEIKIPTLTISILDSVTISEYIELIIPTLFILGYDSIIVSEYIELSLSFLSVLISDSVNVHESLGLMISVFFISKFDSIDVSEDVLFEIPVLSLSVYEQVDVSEDALFDIPVLSLSVYEQVDVSEDALFEIPVLSLSVYEQVDVSEYRSLITNEPNVYTEIIFVSDIADILIPNLINKNEDEYITIYENVEIRVPTLPILLYDSVGISESIEQILPFLFISETDSISVSDDAEQIVPIIFISEIDPISVSDNAEQIVLIIFISEIDSISVSENIELIISELFISKFDFIEISESILLSQSALILSVSDAITVTENLSMAKDFALTDNLISYWKLDGDSTDATATGNDGSDTAIDYNSSVILDTTSKASTNSSNPLSWSHTGSSGISLAVVAFTKRDNCSLTSITYGGEAMTFAGTVNGQGYIYYLVNPPTGSQTVEITISGYAGGWLTGIAMTFSGTNTSSPIGGTATHTFTGTSESFSITAQNANSVVLGLVLAMYNTTGMLITEGSGYTEINEQDDQQKSDAGDYVSTQTQIKSFATSGSKTVDWTLNNSTTDGESLAIEINGYTSGKINQGAVFNGTTSKIALGTPITMPTDLTISAWVKKVNGVTTNIIFADSNGTAEVDWELYASGQKINFAWGSATGNYRAYRTDNEALDENWHFVIVTQTGTDAPIFYIDGSSVASSLVASDGVADKPSSGQGSAIGVEPGTTPSGFFDGTIDEVGIWSRALSGTEVGQLWNGSNGLSYPFATISFVNFDSISVSEDVRMEIPLSPALLVDQLSISEDVRMEIPLYPALLIDQLSISEDVSIIIQTLIFELSDNVSLAENVNIDASSFFAEDSVFVAENIEIFISGLFVLVYEEISLSESCWFNSLILFSVYDSISNSESISAGTLKRGRIFPNLPRGGVDALQGNFIGGTESSISPYGTNTPISPKGGVFDPNTAQYGGSIYGYH
jgi:hypothetical protein